MISVETARVRYTGDGVTIVFQVPWYFLAADDLLVVVYDPTTGLEAIPILDTDYSVAGAGFPSGALIFAVAPASGKTVAVARNDTVVQPLNLEENEAFPATAVELGLDRLAMFATLAKERSGRALSLHDSDPLAGGRYNAMNNRIVNVSDPVADTDAATRSWVLAQISNPVGWTPDKDTAQWNADRLQGRAIATTAPTDQYVLTWNATNSRWEPKASNDAGGLLNSSNTWTATNIFGAGLVSEGNINLSVDNTALIFGAKTQALEGRFYGTPYSQRTLIRSNTSPSSCNVGIAPWGANEAGVDCFGAADPDNSPVLHIAASATAHVIDTGKTGTGTTQALTLSANGTGAIKIATNGRVLVASASDVGSAMAVNGFVTKITGAFRAHRNSVSYSVASSTFVPIDFTAEEYDQSGWFDLTTNRYTPLIPGKYLLMGGNGPDASVAVAHRHETLLYKNGSVHRLFNNQHTSGATGSTACGGAIVGANGSTDYFELYVWHDFGSSTSFSGLPNDCFFEGAHLG